MNFQFRITPASAQRFRRGFELAVRAVPPRAVEFLARKAVNQLREFDRRLGHRGLADLWTYQVRATSDGAWARVHSKAEEMVFYNKTTHPMLGRERSTVYPVPGPRLLAILEGGAKAHPIRPRRSPWLTVPVNGFERRTAEHKARHGRFSFLNPDPGYYENHTTEDVSFRRRVEHPGVRPNRNVQATEAMLLAALSTVGPTAAGITVDIR